MMFQLEPHERENALWKKLKGQMEDRLDAERKKNDANRDPIETANIRGRIAVLKYFLALDNPGPSSESSAEKSPLDW